MQTALRHSRKRSHNLQPHRFENFKFSTDPHFVEKLRDVVGVYMNPAVDAMVLSVDEKSSVQSLETKSPDRSTSSGRSSSANARLCPQWNHHALCSAQHAERKRDRAVLDRAPAYRVSSASRAHRQERSGEARHPSYSKLLCNAQASGDKDGSVPGRV